MSKVQESCLGANPYLFIELPNEIESLLCSRADQTLPYVRSGESGHPMVAMHHAFEYHSFDSNGRDHLSNDRTHCSTDRTLNHRESDRVQRHSRVSFY
jgi:hypothetical protein